MPRLSETPSATTDVTPSERRVMSSEVPVNGENPWWRRLSRSPSSRSSGSTSMAGVPSSMCRGSLSRETMNGQFAVWEPARPGRNAAVQWITGSPACLAAWSRRVALAVTSWRAHASTSSGNFVRSPTTPRCISMTSTATRSTGDLHASSRALAWYPGQHNTG